MIDTIESTSTQSSLPEDDMWLQWEAKEREIYDKVYYEGNKLVAYINNQGHRMLEFPFAPKQHFNKVLEVGAGTGMHLEYVRHSFDAYYLTDINPGLLDRARNRHINRTNVHVEVANAIELPYADHSFDRVISVYNLEHLPNPHLVLREWSRVLKPGGILSISIPAEGGIPWNLGRYLTTRRSFAKEGLDLDYIIAREHINACYRLVSLINYYFPQRKDNWFPLKVPNHHLNLVYATTVTKSI